MLQQTNYSQTPKPQIKAGWLPFLVGALLCMLVGLLWWTLDKREQTNLQNKINAEAKYLATLVDADLRNRIPTLERMARKWEIYGGMPKEEFISDAEAYLSDVPGFQALEWIDKNFFVRWIVPFKGNEKAQNLNLAFEKKRRIALEKAKRIRIPTVTSPIDLVQGGKGFLLYVPIYTHDKFNGFILAVFRVQKWLSYIFSFKKQPLTTDDFRISVFFDGVLVYKDKGWDLPQNPSMSAVANTQIMDHHLSVHIRPTLDFIKHNTTILPKLTAFFGILLSLLVAFIVYLLQKEYRTEEALKQSKDFLNTLLNSMPIPVFYKNRDGQYMRFNKAFETFFGATRERLVGKTVFDINPPELAKIYHAKDNELFESGGEQHYESQVKNTFGITRDVIFAKAALTDSKGTVSGLIGAIYDITERKKAEDALREAKESLSVREKKYRILADNMKDFVWTTDMNLQSTYLSPSIEKVFGYSIDELMKMPIDKLMTAESFNIAMAIFAEEMEKERVSTFPHDRSRIIEIEYFKKDGTTILTEVKLALIRDERGATVGIIGCGRDITERKRVEKALRESEHKYQELSTIDDLTQLYNSRHFYAQLEREMERSNRYEQPFTIIMLDLDKFKDFNDTYGHIEGDYVLSRIGQVIKLCLRETDSAYRYGGEEFMIILPMTTSEEGIITAKRIQTELNKKAFSPVLGKEVYMTMSIGLAQYKPKEEMKAFVNRVDKLMYQAKQNGRDRVCPES